MNKNMECRLDAFGDVRVDRGHPPFAGIGYPQRVIEEGAARRWGKHRQLRVGEHHRDDFAISAPELVLAAMRARRRIVQLRGRSTERTRLGTAVTALRPDDPVRVFEKFATLDALARGRTEITVGRGSFIVSVPLFGCDLADYERLFSQKLDLFPRLLTEGPCPGRALTGPRRGTSRFTRTEASRIRTWAGVGGSLESVVRAAQYGFPLVLAIIGASPARFAPFIDLHHRALP
jgi:alkanesulfonate monooxygenase SsuD/methylene tetrahydromethanopterin reductase-like flavin-dependent oxidoreductase (luciferase family)